jgi:hypothetical protein
VLSQTTGFIHTQGISPAPSNRSPSLKISNDVIVKGVGAQGSRPWTTKLVAWVGNGAGFLPRAPYGEGDEIKIKQGD